MTGGSDRKVVFALLGIAALCLAGLGTSLYRSKSAELRKLERDLRQKESQFEEVQAKLASQPQLEARYEELQARLSVLEPALPDSAYIPTFLRQLEALAVGTKNQIVMIRPKPKAPRQAGASVQINDETGEITDKGKTEPDRGPKAGEEQKAELPYDQVPIELRVEGTYWTAINFLEELQRFPKMIAVNEVGFFPKQVGLEGTKTPELTASMDLTAVVTKGGSDGKT